MDLTQLKPGDIVEHKLSKDWLMVLNISSNSAHALVTCRTKSLDIKEFYDFELQPQSNK
jgi:hypothetical protein